jgi:hypothetical protein
MGSCNAFRYPLKNQAYTEKVLRPIRRLQTICSHVVTETSCRALAANNHVVKLPYVHATQVLTSEVLREACCQNNATIAVYWTYDPLTRSLHVADYFLNDQGQSEKEQASLDLLCGEASETSTVRTGVGAVGRVHAQQRPESCESTSELLSADGFIHICLADRLGVKWVGFLPYLSGVLEVGARGSPETFDLGVTYVHT